MVRLPSAVDLLNAFAALEIGGVTRDVSYGDKARQRLDVYHAKTKSTSAPVIVFFYGGGWEEGEKADYLFVAAALAARGFTVVIPDYRLFPEVRFPTFVQDAAAALRWTHDHIAQLQGDPNRIVVMGHSAGAHIAAMLTFDRRFLHAFGLDPRRHLCGMIGLAGPYDFLPLHSETLKAIFGPKKGLAATQPINFVDGDAPPAFLAAPRHDDTVDPGNTLRLAKRIRAKGGEAQVKIYNRVTHKTLIGAFAPPLRFLAPVLGDVVEFASAVTPAHMRGKLVNGATL